MVEGGGILAVGRASHRVGIAGVRVVVKNLDTDFYWNGSDWQADYITTKATLGEAGQRKAAWTVWLSDESLVPGRYRVRGFAYSVEGNGDAYGGDLVEFDYRSEPDGPAPTTSTTQPPVENCGNRAILEPSWN